MNRRIVYRFYVSGEQLPHSYTVIRSSNTTIKKPPSSSWVFPVFFKGRKRELVQDDLYQALDSHKSNVLGDKLSRAWQKEIKNARENGKKPSLLSAMLNVFGWQIALLGLILACLEFFLR